MTTRDALIDSFLKNAGLRNPERIKIPGDASFRHYERIKADGSEYILMDSPPDKEDVKPFIKIDRILRDLELSAPEIYEQDIANGFLLIEDLGCKKFNDIFKEAPAREEELYKLAVDVLVEIYDQRKIFSTYGLLPYTHEKLMGEALLFIDWYMGLRDRKEGNMIAVGFTQRMRDVLDRLRFPNDVLTLRDYHADNLMLLEERKASAKVGLLDFQDGVMGHIAYDLVSLLEDARRDVSENIQKNMIEYFLERTNLKDRKNDFLHDYHILGTQRNLKILGIFSRLNIRDKKPVYLELIPRVKKYLMQDLEHDALRELKSFLVNECKL